MNSYYYFHSQAFVFSMLAYPVSELATAKNAQSVLEIDHLYAYMLICTGANVVLLFS